jgi:hypothetical protein
VRELEKANVPTFKKAPRKVTSGDKSRDASLALVISSINIPLFAEAPR